MSLIANPPALILPHHSSGDWDFSNINWGIDNTQFVSAPSSVRGDAILHVLAKGAFPTAINQGKLTSHVRMDINMRYFGVLFRNQKPAGAADGQNSYLLLRRFDGLFCKFQRYEAGGVVWTGDLGALDALASPAWHHLRVSWWESWGKLRMRLERWIGAAWVQEGVDQEDPANKWSGNPVNRAGIYFQATTWYDDTTPCWE